MSSLHNTVRHSSLSFRSESRTPSPTGSPSYKSTPATSLFSDSRNPSSTGGLQEFFYELSNAGKPYLKVTFLANGVLAKHQPTIVQGMRLSGNVQFHLGNGDDVLSLIGTAHGKLLYGSHEGGGKSLVFLRIVKEFYSRQSDSPRPSGDFSWSFDIELPKDVTIPVPEMPGVTRTFIMPQTTQERQSRASTVYGMTFQIVRGRFKTNKELSFPFNYIPIIPAPPLPKKRREAYQDGTPLPSPSADPSSWKALDHVQILGTLSNKKPVDVGCTLFIGNPVTYTRGSVIPLYIQFEGADQESLHLLASPKAILVCMKRIINTHPIPTKKTSDIHIWKPMSSYSRPAVWEPTPIDGSLSAKPGQIFRVAFRGEIHLSLNLIPTTCIGHFTVDYSVILVTPAVPGFERSESNPSQILATKNIQIVTAYATGPRPKRMLPPSEESLQELFQYRGKDFNLQYKVAL